MIDEKLTETFDEIPTFELIVIDPRNIGGVVSGDGFGVGWANPEEVGDDHVVAGTLALDHPHQSTDLDVDPDLFADFATRRVDEPLPWFDSSAGH